MGSKEFGETKVDLIGSRTRLRPSMDPTMALQYTKHGPLYIFVFYATKMGSRDSGDTKVDPHWVLDPAWSFIGLCHGPTIHLTWSFIYWLYFYILCNKNGIKGLWGDKGRPHWVQDPPWSFNGPYHGPTIHQTWPFIYWLYFCILCNKNGIKGLWGYKGPPSLGLGPALVLQWTLPWPYNTPDLALLDSETSAG